MSNLNDIERIFKIYTGLGGAPAHPNSPVGGGGPGYFCQQGSLGINDPFLFSKTLSHPKSPENRHITPEKIEKDIQPELEIARLREIRKLVEANNRSSLDPNTVICQIYMESRFNANAGATHDARGLMQLQKQGVQQVFKYRKQKKFGHMPSDKDTKAAFEEGAALHSSKKIFDEDTNIQLGTEYMQYWIDTSDSVEDAYKSYRGLANGIYYQKISRCAAQLKSAPEPMQLQLLKEMVK